MTQSKHVEVVNVMIDPAGCAALYLGMASAAAVRIGRLPSRRMMQAMLTCESIEEADALIERAVAKCPQLPLDAPEPFGGDAPPGYEFPELDLETD